MQKDMSVMNNLHQIGDRLSAARRPGPEDQNPAMSENFQNRQNHVSVSSSAANVVSDKLQDALIRRFEDYRHSKEDLEERIIRALASRENQADSFKSHIQQLEAMIEKLNDYEKILVAEKVPDLKPDDPAFQSILADRCIALDRTRLEVMRLLASLPQEDIPDTPVSPAAQNNVWSPEQMTGGQLFRCGCIFFLPVVTAIIISALLIAFSIIAAFNGTIRW